MSNLKQPFPNFYADLVSIRTHTSTILDFDGEKYAMWINENPAKIID